MMTTMPIKAQPFEIRYDTNGRMCNPALPAGCDGVPGVSFRNLKPSSRELRRSEKHLAQFPCPFSRQYAVCASAEVAARLGRLFAAQRAKIRKATGLPYVEDEIAQSVVDRLAAMNLSIGTSLANFQ